MVEVCRYLHDDPDQQYDYLNCISGVDYFHTDPKKAAAGTIRADFAQSIDANAVHGSDAAETAAVECAYFFPALAIYRR